MYGMTVGHQERQVGPERPQRRRVADQEGPEERRRGENEVYPGVKRRRVGALEPQRVLEDAHPRRKDQRDAHVVDRSVGRVLVVRLVRFDGGLHFLLNQPVNYNKTTTCEIKKNAVHSNVQLDLK